MFWWNSNSNSCRDVAVLSAGGLKDVPVLKLRVPALTSRVCLHSYWDLSFWFLCNTYLLYGFVSFVVLWDGTLARFGLLSLAMLCDLAEGITLGSEFLLHSFVFFLASSRNDKVIKGYQEPMFGLEIVWWISGSESHPPMLNKENYVPWSSRLLRYAKSRPNGKLIHNSIINGSNTGIQEKKAKLFNEWERFTFNEGESIESYYHRFLKVMNDLKRKKHFPEKIASNLKFLNKLQPEWSRHKEVDELKAERLTKTQDPLALMANSNNPYAFPAPHQDQPSFNQKYMQQPMPNPEDITDPTTAMNMALALMAKAFKLNYSTLTNNNQRISSNLKNRQIAQPGMNMSQDRQMQMVGGNGGNQFRQYAWQNLENLTGYNDVQNVRNQGVQNAVQNLRVQNIRNQNGLIGVQRNRNKNHIGNGNLMAARAEGNAAGQSRNQIRCYNCRGVGIQLQAEEYDLMAAVADLDEIEEVNANCILMANLQQASTLGTQTDRAPVYDSDGPVEVAFRRNALFVKNLEGVDLLKGDRSTNLYTINLHDMASASPICLMAPASSTKSWLWHQRLSRLNFDTINDLARNDLVSGLLKFKYHKEHLSPS
nr:integrase, catalytic region, zinc finger, CCHC-type, peptidase aspartic, catalytic [Tanacetum cinerariifolium]